MVVTSDPLPEHTVVAESADWGSEVKSSPRNTGAWETGQEGSVRRMGCNGVLTLK